MPRTPYDGRLRVPNASLWGYVYCREHLLPLCLRSHLFLVLRCPAPGSTSLPRISTSSVPLGVSELPTLRQEGKPSLHFTTAPYPRCLLLSLTAEQNSRLHLRPLLPAWLTSRPRPCASVAMGVPGAGPAGLCGLNGPPTSFHQNQGSGCLDLGFWVVSPPGFTGSHEDLFSLWNILYVHSAQPPCFLPISAPTVQTPGWVGPSPGRLALQS